MALNQVSKTIAKASGGHGHTEIHTQLTVCVEEVENMEHLHSVAVLHIADTVRRVPDHIAPLVVEADQDK